MVFLRAIADRCSIEVFGGQGEVVITDLLFPASSGFGLFAEGGVAVLDSLTLYPLSRTTGSYGIYADKADAVVA